MFNSLISTNYIRKSSAILVAMVLLFASQLISPAFAAGTGTLTVNINSAPANSSVVVSIGSDSTTVTSDPSGNATAVFTNVENNSYSPVAHVSSGGYHTYAPTSSYGPPTVIDATNQNVVKTITLRPVFTVVASVSGIPNGTANLTTQVNTTGMNSYSNYIPPVSNPSSTESVVIQDIPAGSWNFVFAADGVAAGTASMALGSNQVTNINVTLAPALTLSGVVRDISGNPIPGADVDVWSGCNGSLCSTTTDNAGNYSISGLSSNSFQINLSTVINSTQVSSSQNIVVTGTTRDFTLAIGSAQISGVVQEDTANEDLVSGAMLNAFSVSQQFSQTSFSTTTASNGQYTLSGLPAGTIGISTSKMDSQTFQNMYVSNHSNITLTEGQTRSKNIYLLPVLTGSNTLSGYVTVQGTNTPVENAWVNISDYMTGTYRNAQTNSSGYYEVLNLPNGTYNVGSSSSDYQYSHNRVVVTGNATKNISLVPLTIGTKTVSGLVTDSRTNNPVEGISVNLSSLGRYYSATTGSDGAWTVSGVAEGTYNAYVNLPQGSGEFYEWPQVADITVGSTNVVRNISVRSIVAGTGRIYGVLKNELTYEPIAGAVMSAYMNNVNGFEIPSVTTNSRGEFSFGDLPQGQFHVMAEKEGFVEIRLSNPEEEEMGFGGGGGPLVGVVDLETGEQAYLAAKLTQKVSGSASITGTLKSYAGRLISDQWVWLQDSKGQIAGYATTDEDGRFNFDDLAAGAYFLNSGAQGLGSAQQKVTVSTSAVTQDVVLKPLGIITGKVLDADGNSIPCAQVTAYQRNSDGTRGAIVASASAEYTSDAGAGSGTYSLSVASGTYFLRLSQRCWNTNEKIIVDFASSFWSSSSSAGTELPVSAITVLSGQTEIDKDFTVTANGGQITGKIVAETPEGIAAIAQGKFVTITIYKNVSGTYEAQGYLSQWTSGRENGDFSVNGLSAGSYKIKITDPMNSSRGFETKFVGGNSLATAEVFNITAGRRLHIGQVVLSSKIPAGDPSAVSSSQLTSTTEDMIDAPSSVEPEQTISVEVGEDMAGEWVSVWAHSTPTELSGWVQVAADGTVTATVPSDLPLGSHRIVVQDADDKLVGWSSTVVAENIDSGSSSTSAVSSNKGKIGSASVPTSDKTQEGSSPLAPRANDSSASSDSSNVESTDASPPTEQSGLPLWAIFGLFALVAVVLIGGLGLYRVLRR